MDREGGDVYGCLRESLGDLYSAAKMGTVRSPTESRIL